jgi:putative molybdopterin biosynthesis protein
VTQRQFLDVVDEAVAHARFEAACAHLTPEAEAVAVDVALGRVLAADVTAAVDVPAFDRSNVDGYAVRAADTFGAEELEPRALGVDAPTLAAGQAAPEGFSVAPGSAVTIATGGVVPRGADAVVMVEHTVPEGDRILVSRPVAPGANVTFAGSDIGRGDLVGRRGDLLTSRETGVLAAVGVDRVIVVRRPRVAVLSTGDEIVAPGRPLPVGSVYDSNRRILLDAVAELGCEPLDGGILPDDESAVAAALEAQLAGGVDVLLLSGGTSKGEGDVNATVVSRLAGRHPGSPGVVVHGVALKPGKPILLAVVAAVPVVVLPGFPTSAVFTFHEFVAPLLRRLAGRRDQGTATVRAVAPIRIDSTPGRTEYSLVDLVEGASGLAAYPLGAGSGSVTAFARADGFVRIPASVEYLAAGEEVEVRLLDPEVRPADLAAIGSHCVGLDHLLGALTDRGFRVKSIPVGSQGGLIAVGRGEADIAGIHLLDPQTGTYNAPFLPPGVRLLCGYRRRQGIVFRRGDPDLDVDRERELLAALGNRQMVNRNPGSGTRVLIDRILGDRWPDGYLHQARTHHAVAAAVEQGRADWGVTIETVAAAAGLGFHFLTDEHYDFAVPEERWDRPGVLAFRELLESDEAADLLRRLGFERP